MTKEQQVEKFDELTKRAEEILLNKGDDYTDEDRLSNFKYAGNICRISPAQHCLALIATKVARLGVLLDGKIPKNESIMDSIVDLFNYSALLYMIQDEDMQDRKL